MVWEFPLTPAQAGVHGPQVPQALEVDVGPWMPACAGIGGGLGAVLDRGCGTLGLNPHMANTPLTAFHDPAHPEVDGAEMHLAGFIVQGIPVWAIELVLLVAPGGEVFLVVGHVSHPDLAGVVGLPKNLTIVHPAPAFDRKQLPPHPRPEIDREVLNSRKGEANVHAR